MKPKSPDFCKLIVFILLMVVCNNGFSQAFTESGVTTGTNSPVSITVDGTTPGGIPASPVYGIYIGKGANAGSPSSSTSTAVGVGALATHTGTRNTAIGYNALNASPSGGSNNTAVGNNALAVCTNSNCTAVGNASLAANISGTNNTAMGSGSLQSSTTSQNNVAIGVNAMSVSANTANYNVAVGTSALAVSASNSNTGIGFSALGGYNGTAGSQGSNSAIGYGSLIALTSGSSNSSLGTYAFRYFTTGNQNTGLGTQALINLTSGSNNVGIGFNTTVQDPTGSNQLSISNVINGINMVAGSGNIAIGLQPIPTTPASTVVGTNHYSRLHIGGSQAGVVPSLQLDYVPIVANPLGRYLYVDAEGVVGQTTLPTGNLNNCHMPNIIPVSTANGDMNCSEIYDDGTSVGIGAAFNSGAPNFAYSYPSTPGNWYTGGPGSPTIPATGNVKLAVDGVTEALAFYAFSDSRYKNNIKSIENAIKYIKQLRGVSYIWNNDSKNKKQFNKIPQLGFIAQEVEKVIPEAVLKNADGFYSMNYFTLIPILTEGIKEQQIQIEQQNVRLANAEIEILNLKNKLNQLIPGEVIVKDDYFKIFPNPVTGMSMVSYKLDNAAANTTFFIFDLQGKMIKQYLINSKTNTGEISINKSDLKNGMYILSLVSNNTEIQSKKILITN